MSQVTVVINTHNEQDSIADCIHSAKYLSPDIIVVDMESTDNTVHLAKRAGAQVVSYPFSFYVEPARESSILSATGEWVFILDADERMTPELAHEIRIIIFSGLNSLPTHYKVPRKNIFGKKWLAHGGWWPDHQMRLLKKSALVKWPARIHATPEIRGDVGLLQNPITHFFHGNLQTMVNKTILFEDIESDLLYKAGRDVGVVTFFRKYTAELFRRLIKNRGFADGAEGLIESFYQAYSKTITWLYLYEKKFIVKKASFPDSITSV